MFLTRNQFIVWHSFLSRPGGESVGGIFQEFLKLYFCGVSGGGEEKRLGQS